MARHSKNIPNENLSLTGIGDQATEAENGT